MSSQIAIRLIVSFLVAYHPKVGDAQFQQHYPRETQYYREPLRQPGSITKANSQAASQNLNVGDLFSIGDGLSNSQVVTNNNGGFQNGGTTSGAESNAYSNNLNLGLLDVSSTLSQSKSFNNDQVSHGLAHDLNVGGIGFGTSLSRDNLRNGIGLRQGKDGGASIGLGLLNIDLLHKSGPSAAGQAQANTGVNAIGSGAQTNAHSQTQSQSQNFGGIGFTKTQSESGAVGIAQNGFTSGFAEGNAQGAATNAISARDDRRQSPFIFPQGFAYDQPGRQHHLFRRQPQRRGGFRQSGFFNQNADAQGTASSFDDLFEQQSGANTQSMNIRNQFGMFQGNTGSSIASNLAKDGSSGQVSAANTAQQSSLTDTGSTDKNAAQSQSANFDKNSQQASSSNADTSKIKTGNSETIESNSGAMAQQQNQFGSSANTANTNSKVINDGKRQGSQSNANSQSNFRDTNGGVQGSNTASKSQSIQGPNGFVSNSASSQSSSFSRGNQRGGNNSASSSSSSSSGTGPNGSFTNAQGFSGTGSMGRGRSQALSRSKARSGSRGNKSFANGQASSRTNG